MSTKKPMEVTSVKLSEDEKKVWRERAQAENISISDLIRTAVNDRITRVTHPALANLEADGDWLLHLAGLARAMDTWFGPKNHDWRQAHAWLVGVLAPKLAASEIHICPTETRRVVERLEDLSVRLGFKLDNLDPEGAPHDGLGELLAYAEGIIAGQLAVLNSKELDHLRRANSY